MSKNPKILVVLGPTATGKSSLAVDLALEFNGEIISADSRQAYKDLNIGTGKVTKKEMRGVPHYLLDILSPKKVFTVHDYKNLAEKKIEKILSQNKLPIIVGGTGFYIQAVVDDVVLPEVSPNLKLRKELAKKTPKELFEMLQKIDPKRAAEVDPNNSRHLIRAIEIAKKLGSVPAIKTDSKYDSLFIGLDLPDQELREKIHKRLLERIRIGMIGEAKRLYKGDLSYKRMENLGLEYKFLAKHLKGELTKNEMIKKLETAIWQYAKRQRTWFKKNKKIKWFKPIDKKKIEDEVKKFCGR